MDFADAQKIKPNGMVSYGEDASLFVEFSILPIKNEFKSGEAKRPIYDDKVFVEIHFPGDKLKVVKREVDPNSDPERWPKQWSAFLAQGEQTQSGLPVIEWPVISKSEAMELKGLKIHTVEQLAALPDTACTWLGSTQMRTKAQAWLEGSKKGGAVDRLQAQIDQLSADNKALQEQIHELVKTKKEDNPPKKQKDAA